MEALSQSTEYTRSNVKGILGIDIDPISVEKARSKLGQMQEIKFVCADFLSLDREQLFSDMPIHNERSRLVAVGGPPYTPKHLPEKFILHSILGMGAEVVVFILPKRCEKDAEAVKKNLNVCSDCESYCYLNRELENISFSFEDTTVPQPSILQCWFRQSRNVNV